MLKIRLKKIGRKKYPVYKIVVTKNLTARNSKSICEIGYYNPIFKTVFLNHQLLYFYINSGVYPTSTVRHLIYNYLLKFVQKN